jgi:hypothetical protein
MPKIELSDTTYAKLQRLGTAFVDTPETVIARLADAALRAQSQQNNPSSAQALSSTDIIELDPFFTGNLAHTRVRRATFADKEIEPARWNNLLRIAHLEALPKFGSIEALKEASSARLRKGKYELEGYKYVPSGGFSIQGVDSNQSWANSLRLAKKLNVPIEIEFEWYPKEEAAHPGKRGHMRWEPAVE